MGAVVAIVVIGALAAAIAAARIDRQRRRDAAATVHFEVDANGVRRTLADGRAEAVAWDELDEVRIVVLPRGPWDDRVRVVLDGGGERGCIVPRDLAESGGLLPALGRLPRFDARALAVALDHDAPGTTVVWRRPSAST